MLWRKRTRLYARIGTLEAAQLANTSSCSHLEHSGLACSHAAQGSNRRHVVQTSDTPLQVGCHMMLVWVVCIHTSAL